MIDDMFGIIFINGRKFWHDFYFEMSDVGAAICCKLR
jgi:hypothetical protein